MLEFDYLKPQTLEELTTLLHETGGRILAGGTDIIPQMRHNLFSVSLMIDVSELSMLNFIEGNAGWIQIGSLVTHKGIKDSSLLQKENPALVAAAALVGCDQTRNRGTLGGNIANASPAADTIPALLILDAVVVLRSLSGERTLPLNEFILGPRKTLIAADEYIHSVKFLQLSGNWGTSFLKLGERNGMAISVANAAAAVVLGASGMVSDARIALGSVAPVVVRCLEAEAFVIGKQPTDEIIQRAASLCLREISPISDVRSTQEYRAHAAVVLARRALKEAVNQAEGILV